MGTQFTPNSIPRNIIIMKFLIGLSLVAVAVAVPIGHTPEVLEATKQHLAAHAAALRGEHASLAPVQGAAWYLADDAAVAAAKPYLADTTEVMAAKPYLADAPDVAAAKPYLADAPDVAAKPYLADTADVAAAKAEFQKYFDAAAAGTPLTPVTVPVLKTVPVLPKLEVPAVVAPKVVQYTVPSAYYAGYHPYHYTYPYAAYPYWTGFTGLPVVSAPVVAAEKAVAEE